MIRDTNNPESRNAALAPLRSAGVHQRGLRFD
jgi:hypothetical protein